MTLAAGTMLGAYRIQSLLGRGGMGEVYLATHEGLGRRVALKLLAPELAADERFRARFIAESRLAASLDHPHIVPIYEAGESDGRLFLAMRYVEGADLGALIARDGPLEPARALGLLRGIAEALDAAHERGLVHRDVKPGNILIARTSRGDEHAYLGDFGLVKQLGSDAGFTRSGQLVGSVDYVAPEQVEGRPIDGRVDVYSLACVLYTILSGRPPYERETEMATLWAHVQAPPPRLSDVGPELASLDDVVARGMAKDPGERYGTAAELTAAAGAAIESQSETALTQGFLFADLRGYTDFVERHGDDAAADLLERYRRLVREVVARHKGAEVRTEGDSFYVIFPTASRAVNAALEIVEAARRSTAEEPDHPVRVGVGVHAGETAQTREGPVGSAVNLAARICSQAQAGEVLVSDTVRGLIRTRRVAAFESVGRRRLKGIAEPLSLYRAVAAEAAVGAEDAGPDHARMSPRRRLGGTRGRLIGVVVGTVAISTVVSFGLLNALAGRGVGGTEASNPGRSLAANASSSASRAVVDTSPAVFVKGMEGPGTYDSDAAGIRVRLEVPAGWRAVDVQKHSLRLALVDRAASEATFIVGQPKQISKGSCLDRNPLAVEPFLKNLIPMVLDSPDFQPEEGRGFSGGLHQGRYVVTRTVAGYNALHLDATVTGGVNCWSDGLQRVALLSTSDLTYVGVVRNERFRVLVVKFGSNDVLAILARAPSASEFDILTAKLEQMLRGLEFLDS